MASKCAGLYRNGNPCRNKPSPGYDYCGIHIKQDPVHGDGVVIVPTVKRVFAPIRVRVDVDESKTLTDTLFDHQRQSIQELEEREALDVFEVDGLEIRSHISILADKKGAGKTRVVCALLHGNKMPLKPRNQKQFVDYRVDSLYAIRTVEVVTVDTSIIIVAPALMGQWQDELTKWGLDHTVVASESRIPETLIRRDRIIVVSTRAFRPFWDKHFEDRSRYPKRLIYDEPDTAHISGFPSLDSCQSVILVSATAGNLRDIKSHRNFHYLKRLFGHMNSNLQKYLTIKQGDAAIDGSIVLPPIIHKRVKYYTHIYMRAVMSFAPSTVRTMIQRGALREALAALQVVGDTQTNLVDAMVSYIQERIDVTKRQIRSAQHRGHATDGLDEKLAKYEKQLVDMRNRIERNASSDCCICMSEMVTPTLCRLCCANFCANCILRWVIDKNKCPCCRGGINPSQDLSTITAEVKVDETADDANRSGMDRVADRTPPENGRTRPQALADIIEEVVASGPNYKLLLFGGYLSVIDEIKTVIEDFNINWASLRGTAAAKYKTVQDFRNGNINCLIINNEIDSAGIHVPETTHTLIYHRVNANVRTQLIGRAQRIGRTEPLTLYELYA